MRPFPQTLKGIRAVAPGQTFTQTRGHYVTFALAAGSILAHSAGEHESMQKNEGLKCREFVAGGTAELDVYEGMTHVFQSYMVNTPEQKAAYAEMKNFSARNLHPAKR